MARAITRYGSRFRRPRNHRHVLYTDDALEREAATSNTPPASRSRNSSAPSGPCEQYGSRSAATPSSPRRQDRSSGRGYSCGVVHQSGHWHHQQLRPAAPPVRRCPGQTACLPRSDTCQAGESASSIRPAYRRDTTPTATGTDPRHHRRRAPHRQAFRQG